MGTGRGGGVAAYRISLKLETQQFGSHAPKMACCPVARKYRAREATWGGFRGVYLVRPSVVTSLVGLDGREDDAGNHAHDGHDLEVPVRVEPPRRLVRLLKHGLWIGQES
jgi:hypothetical protein